jgi:hypothetical protein
MSKPSFAAVALVAAVSCPGAASAQGTVGSLTGVITDAAGSGVAGAFVQMKNVERRLNFMVITQEGVDIQSIGFRRANMSCRP